MFMRKTQTIEKSIKLTTSVCLFMNTVCQILLLDQRSCFTAALQWTALLNYTNKTRAQPLTDSHSCSIDTVTGSVRCSSNEHHINCKTRFSPTDKQRQMKLCQYIPKYQFLFPRYSSRHIITFQVNKRTNRIAYPLHRDKTVQQTPELFHFTML